MREESAFDPEAVSPSHAYGLMQLIVPTAQHVGKGLGVTVDLAALTTPEMSIKLGCRYLGELRTRFASNPDLAVPAYNAGPGASQRWLQNRVCDDFDLWVESISFDETRRYVKRVLTSAAAYSYLYEKQGSVADLVLRKRVEQ
jgi:soluble lytic murein transglycosylase